MKNGQRSDKFDVEKGYRRAESDFSTPSVPSLSSSRAGAAQKLQETLLKGDKLDSSYRSISSGSSRGREDLKGAPGSKKRGGSETKLGYVRSFLEQVPAVALGMLLNLMWAIPFGVSYFPIKWRATELGPPTKGGGAFPLPGKDALGIRIFLFSTLIGQFVFTFTSKFKNPIGMQMIENVPFTQALALICVSEQGWGIEALSTLFFLFGASSVVVGVVFFLLGWLELGNMVYFIPNHVLLGCIGGIGVFIIQVAIEVTINVPFEFNLDGLKECIENFDLLGVVIAFEIILRLISYATRKPDGSARYPLLAPIYFCMITPIFYLLLFLFRVKLSAAQDAGYFFPPLDSCNPETNDCSDNGSWLSAVFNEDLWDIWRGINFTTISWTAVYKSIPTLIGLTAFSLIHVPINIPAFAVSTNVESDMNNELKSHGYSNALAGILGGLQNYMCYSNSVAYAKSGGTGRASSLGVTLLTVLLFFVGPNIAAFTPRCMAGTLLVHLGLELFIEGAFDSYGNYDSLEYFGIWLIVAVMTWYGMSAALIAGAISAVTTFVVQSIASQNPVRCSMSAVGIRSSKKNRPREASTILEDRYVGRRRILIFQLQGHLFFGNITQLTETISATLEKKRESQEGVWIIIMDFSNVVGIDSSAAQAISKIKKMVHKQFKVSLAIYVTGSPDGFPCQFDLAQDLTKPYQSAKEEPKVILQTPRQTLAQTPRQRKAMVLRKIREKPSGPLLPQKENIPGDKVCDTLDSALIFAEDVLIARVDRTLVRDRISMSFAHDTRTEATNEEDYRLALRCLSDFCPGEDVADVKLLLSLFKKEIWYEGQTLWRQGSISDCAKLILRGSVLSEIEDGDSKTEEIPAGVMVGQLGLIDESDRLSTIRCGAGTAVLYSLDRDSWEGLVKNNPKVARFIDMIALKDLSHRVQQVSNQMFETRTLPV